MSEKKKPNPHAGHRNRMRERFLKEGADSFETHELLELALYNTIPMQNTNVIAHRLLNSFNNSLAMLIDGDHRDIVEKGNVSTNTAIFLNIIGDLAKRYQREKLQQKVVLNEMEKGGQYAVDWLKYETTEKFYMFCLDAGANLIKVVNVAEGSQSRVQVELTTVVREALFCKATSVIFAHNHPGGTLHPSSSDIELTIRLIEGLNTVNIYVTDHVIVAKDQYFSFVKEGIMKQLKQK
ncbi:DNA repair protein RadC [Clostridium sp. MD294]|uniref:JAB domain-containing protein n=1 Tax=Clostridium sp. MD294 TaxID=97138 RepID=UPI0002C907CF|nr:DNA repair protein RadC [Clostridium sp. MD294]NDO46798.1 DNA repair protein RadC [Clostridium sp. MD294]USF28760.1 hypothetical protein C820_000134 [Clostridium sp. MD294]